MRDSAATISAGNFIMKRKRTAKQVERTIELIIRQAAEAILERVRRGRWDASHRDDCEEVIRKAFDEIHKIK